MIPHDALSSAAILRSIGNVLNGLDGLYSGVEVTLHSHGNSSFEDDRVVKITVRLTQNPTYDFTMQTIYFTRSVAEVTTRSESDNRPALPQTGVLADQNALAVGMVQGGLVAGIGITITVAKKLVRKKK